MSRYFVVVDANVLVSSLLSKYKDSSTVKVLEYISLGKIIPLFNNEIIEEYSDVLHREKFHFTESSVEILIQSIYDNGLNVEKIKSGEYFPDSKDAVFYEVCLAKRREGSILVTGNIKHFPKKPFVITPKEIVMLIDKQ